MSLTNEQKDELKIVVEQYLDILFPIGSIIPISLSGKQLDASEILLPGDWESINDKMGEGYTLINTTGATGERMTFGGIQKHNHAWLYSSDYYGVEASNIEESNNYSETWNGVVSWGKDYNQLDKELSKKSNNEGIKSENRTHTDKIAEIYSNIVSADGTSYAAGLYTAFYKKIQNKYNSYKEYYDYLQNGDIDNFRDAVNLYIPSGTIFYNQNNTNVVTGLELPGDSWVYYDDEKDNFASLLSVGSEYYPPVGTNYFNTDYYKGSIPEHKHQWIGGSLKTSYVNDKPGKEGALSTLKAWGDSNVLYYYEYTNISLPEPVEGRYLSSDYHFHNNFFDAPDRRECLFTYYPYATQTDYHNNAIPSDMSYTNGYTTNFKRKNLRNITWHENWRTNGAIAPILDRMDSFFNEGFIFANYGNKMLQAGDWDTNWPGFELGVFSLIDTPGFNKGYTLIAGSSKNNNFGTVSKGSIPNHSHPVIAQTTYNKVATSSVASNMQAPYYMSFFDYTDENKLSLREYHMTSKSNYDISGSSSNVYTRVNDQTLEDLKGRTISDIAKDINVGYGQFVTYFIKTRSIYQLKNKDKK
ncbi:MAG: hypothetical protein HRS57_03055, partial [Mycoplasmataceae bacterium]|nr:hypothetical protein [Mycoplasmataceae bacterium]